MVKQLDIKEQWKTYDPKLKIELVIHDGQWYDKEKWRKVAKIKDVSILEKWIEENKNILMTQQDSYRVNKDEIEKWYKENNFDITKQYIPNNYPPRIWDNKTEAESLLGAPKRLSSYLAFSLCDEYLFDKIKKIVKPYARLSITYNKVYLYTMNASFLRDKLKKELTEEEFESLRFYCRSGLYKRDLLDLSEEFLNQCIMFYLEYTKTTLKPHKKTLDIFLPTQEAYESQVIEWILTALQKFDEKTPVPFSGYLSNVLNHWPYDLPDYELGKELSLYQRKRAKVIKEYLGDTQPTLEFLKTHLPEYSEEVILENEQTLDNWFNIKHQQSYSNNNNITNHTKTRNVFNTQIQKDSLVEEEETNNLVKNVLLAAIESKSYLDGIHVLSQMDNNGMGDFTDLSSEFKQKLYALVYKKG